MGFKNFIKVSFSAMLCMGAMLDLSTAADVAEGSFDINHEVMCCANGQQPYPHRNYAEHPVSEENAVQLKDMMLHQQCLRDYMFMFEGTAYHPGLTSPLRSPAFSESYSLNDGLDPQLSPFQKELNDCFSAEGTFSQVSTGEEGALGLWKVFRFNPTAAVGEPGHSATYFGVMFYPAD